MSLPKRDESRSGSAMRTAFVITSHADVPLLDRLIQVLTRDQLGVRVYVSHDQYGEKGAERLASAVCRVLEHTGGRGDATAIHRVLSLMEQVERDGGADYVAVISGTDFPARPIGEFLEALERSGDGMLHHFPALDPSKSEWALHETRQRYLYRWRPLTRKAAEPRWHWIHGLNYVQPFFRFSVAYGPLRCGMYRGTLPRGLDCYGGSSWFSLSRRAVKYLLEVAGTRPDIMKWAQSSIAIDEAFYHSVLVSSNRFSFINDNGHYIDFAGDGFGHPRVLTLADEGRIVESGAYFVRKVDSKLSAELLDRLDHRVTYGRLDR